MTPATMIRSPLISVDDAMRKMRREAATRTQSPIAQAVDQRIWLQSINRSDSFVNKSVAQARLAFFIPGRLLGNIRHRLPVHFQAVSHRFRDAFSPAFASFQAMAVCGLASRPK